MTSEVFERSANESADLARSYRLAIAPSWLHVFVADAEDPLLGSAEPD